MAEAQFDSLLVNGDVLLPEGRLQRVDIGIADGKIAAILAPGHAMTSRVRTDMSGLTILPGVIDVHLHLGHDKDISRPRFPGDAAQETAAAAAGGVTTMIPYLLSADPYETFFDEVRAVTEEGSRIDFGYHFIISSEEQLAGVARYVSDYGAPSFKIFMNNRGGEGSRLGLPDIDDAFLYRLAEQCSRHGGMVCPHPENIEVAQYLRRAVMAKEDEWPSGLAAWNASRPPFVEADAIQRAGTLCRAVDAPLYVVHTSSAEALAAARTARERGSDITIETCPHYLTHDIGWSGGDIGKINPPLRTASDCAALWDGIRDGVVDTVATDHVHRHVSAKQGGIWNASPGCPGVETLLPVMLSEGYHKRGIPLARIMSMLSQKPAEAMGLGHCKGAIRAGMDADLVIVDLDAISTVTSDAILSSAGYSLYEGWDLRGKVVHTYVRGQCVFENGKLVDDAIGTGRYQRRQLARSAAGARN